MSYTQTVDFYSKDEKVQEKYLVDRHYANTKWPQEVIRYYQDLIKWDCSKDEGKKEECVKEECKQE